MTQRGDGRDYRRGSRDDWEVVPTEYADYDLGQLTSAGEPDGTQGPFDRITVRLLPAGLPAVMRGLAKENRLSVAAVQRIMLRHGLSLARQDKRMDALLAARGKLDALVIISNNISDFDLVDEPTRLQPSEVRQHRVALSSYVWTHEALADLAGDLVLRQSSAVVFACILSLATLPGRSGAFRENLLRDSERFWQFVVRRANYFELAAVELEARR